MVTITFPRAIPDEFKQIEGSFTLRPMVEVSPTRGGKIIAADLGPELWLADYATAELSEARFGVARAFLDTLGNIQTFLGFDRLRTYPLAYRSGFNGLTFGGNPFTGACKISNVTDAFTILLKELPVGFVLSVGDYLAFTYSSTSRALHRVAVGGVANGSGVVTIEVRPAIRTGWAADAVVDLHKAAAHMIAVPNSKSESFDLVTRRGRIAIQAVQSL